MAAKYGFFLAILLVSGSAAPLEEDDMSIFFDHTVRDAEGRIVGGQVAREGAAPWVVALSNGTPVHGLFCGGSLVSPNAIISAAHCIRAVIVGNGLSATLRATVGTNRWNTGGQVMRLGRFVIHPHYVPSTLKNDIGVLRTTQNVHYNNRVAPVGLTWDWIPGWVPSRVHGWGFTRTSGMISNQLMELNLNTFDERLCVVDVRNIAQYLQLRVPHVDPNVELCTFYTTNFGTCNGDSGMPLVRAWDNRQIGVVSWGLPCARGAPDVFARMSAFRSFVENAIRNVRECPHTVRDAEGRIVGGQVAREGAAPWVVALSNGTPVHGLFCGGSLVSPNAIISAAHCIRAVIVGNGLSATLRATVGTNRWNTGGQVMRLGRFVIHPHYVPSTLKNDIGVLRTTKNVHYNNRVAPVGLTWDWIPGWVPSRVHGWGFTRTGGMVSNQLMELNLNTFDERLCVVDVARVAQYLQIRVPHVDPHLELCTFYTTNFGTCNGDSGMALVRAWDNRQIGVVSWGVPCARGAPDVFARMSAFRSFVENAIR